MDMQTQRGCDRCRMETPHQIVGGKAQCQRCAYIDAEAARVAQDQQLQREIQARAAAMRDQSDPVKQAQERERADFAARKAKIKARDKKLGIFLVGGFVVVCVVGAIGRKAGVVPASADKEEDYLGAEFSSMANCLESIQRNSGTGPLDAVTDKPDEVSGFLSNGKHFSCKKVSTGTKGTIFEGRYYADKK